MILCSEDNNRSEEVVVLRSEDGTEEESETEEETEEETSVSSSVSPASSVLRMEVSPALNMVQDEDDNFIPPALSMVQNEEDSSMVQSEDDDFLQSDYDVLRVQDDDDDDLWNGEASAAYESQEDSDAEFSDNFDDINSAGGEGLYSDDEVSLDNVNSTEGSINSFILKLVYIEIFTYYNFYRIKSRVARIIYKDFTVIKD
jgi:hypothetical protein